MKGLRVIWRQQLKVTGSGHFWHRIAFSPDGRYPFVISGERRGEALIAAMKPGALVRVAIKGRRAREVARYPLPHRVGKVR